MESNRSIDAARRDEVLAEAASRHTPATVCCRNATEWLTFKSRLLDAGDPKRGVVLEYPLAQESAPAPDIEQGQYVGVSFRRGHSKCVFGSVVTGKSRFRVDEHNEIGALVVGWPEEICQLQRRLYYRSPVPAGMSIPVLLWAGGESSRSKAGSPGWPLLVGQLWDLSAGGFKVVLPPGQSPRYSVGETVGMEFVPESDRPPILVDAHFRHTDVAEDGQPTLGFQFVGLEHTGRGRSLLYRLGRVVAGWRRQQFYSQGARR